nr:zinc-ribbon domain-containing protein [uncultured Methanoregula sp.]
MFCQKCGAENPDGGKFCNSCGAALVELSGNSKHNEVILAKIATKEQQIKDISQVGPAILIVFGILVCITIVGIVLGLILIGIGIWWSTSRDNEGKKLKNEIKELKAEMET